MISPTGSSISLTGSAMNSSLFLVLDRDSPVFIFCVFEIFIYQYYL
jgi:hypothetical protein